MTERTRGPAAGSTEARDTATRLHSLAIHLLRRVRQTDARSGLSGARASALSVLVFGGPRTIGELAAAEQVAAPTMTRLVAGLEADGHAKRIPDRSDRRVVIVRATARGRRALERARRLRVEQVGALLAEMAPAERAVVAEAVSVLERAMEV
jgi:DNA-binding MarR family transcriptional regulator